MKITSANIVDVENALNAFKAAAQANPDLEAESKKKLAAAVEALTPKDGTTKLLNQAFTYGESWWAKNVLNGGLEGCTTDNKADKIRGHIHRSDAYSRLFNDTATKAKVEKWFQDDFPAKFPQAVPEAA